MCLPVYFLRFLFVHSAKKSATPFRSIDVHTKHTLLPLHTPPDAVQAGLDFEAAQKDTANFVEINSSPQARVCYIKTKHGTLFC